MAAGEITVYEKAGFASIRMYEEDGEIHAVASDFAKALGYRDARDMIRSLGDDEKGTHTVRTPGGPQEMATINEAGMYHAILIRRSACVRDPEARRVVEAVQQWVTHEVLPSIRRDGVYMNVAPDQLGDNAFDKLVSYTMAALDARLRAAEERVEELRPMAELGEAVTATEDVIDMAAMANLLTNAGFRIGRNGLFKLLRDEKILKGGRDWNLPYQEYVDRGYFTVVETPYRKPDGTVHTQLTTYVTGRGQEFLLRRYAGARELAGVRDA